MSRTRFARSAAVFSAAALAVVLTACAPGAGGGASRFPEDVRANFIASCAAGPGADEALCRACYELIEQRYTLEEFEALDRAVAQGTASEEDLQELVDIVMQCAN